MAGTMTSGALKDLMGAQGGPGNQFSQAFNPASQFLPQITAAPTPQAAPPATDPAAAESDRLAELLRQLNPRVFGVK